MMTPRSPPVTDTAAAPPGGVVPSTQAGLPWTVMVTLELASPGEVASMIETPGVVGAEFDRSLTVADRDVGCRTTARRRERDARPGRETRRVRT